MSVLQVGHVIARSHVPRGASARWGWRSIVVGGGFTALGFPGTIAVKTEGGSVPRGNFSNFSMIPTTSTRV
jgi:hypothetical protein